MGSVWMGPRRGSRSSDCDPREVAVAWYENCQIPEFRFYPPSAENERCCRRWLLRSLRNPFGSFPQPGRLPRSTRPSSLYALSPFKSGLPAFGFYSDVHYFFDGHRGGRGVTLVILQSGSFLVIGERSNAQANLLFGLVEPHDLEIHFFADSQRRLVMPAVGSSGNLGAVAQTFHAGGEFHENAEIGRAANSSTHHIAHLMRAEEGLPGVRLQLLHAEGKAAVGRIDVQNYGLNQLTLLHQFGRMLDAFRPGQIRDVHQSIDAFLDFYESAEIGQLAHAALHHRADRVAFRHRGPRIGLELLDAQRHTPFFGLYIQHDRFNLV